MFRKITVLGGIATLIGGSLLVGSAGAAGPPPIDATNYTIKCDTFTKATAGFKPSLVLGGTLPDAIKIKGTLSGCVATPNGANPAVTVVSGSVSGLLNATNNDCLSLLGPSTAAGTLTIKWKTVEKLSSATTTITIGSGDVSGGTATPFADTATYGQFNIASTTQTGPFGGPTGTGAASSTKALTVEGITALGGACADPKGLKAVNFGPTEVNLG